MKYKKMTLAIFSLVFGIIIATPGLAIAEKWPGDSWGGSDWKPNKDSINIFLNRADNHENLASERTLFAAYTRGDTVDKNPTINFNSFACDLGSHGSTKNPKLVISVDGKAESYGICAKIPDTITLRGGTKVTVKDHEGNCALRTKYQITISIQDSTYVNKPGGASNKLRFNVSKADTVFGFLASPKDYSVPFTLGSVDKYDSRNLSIPVSPQNASKLGKFLFYDSDNNKESHVQNSPKDRFNPLNVSVKNGAGSLLGATATWPNDERNGNYWHEIGSTNMYEPLNKDSGISMYIQYFLSANNDYRFRINQLGGDNYIAISMPFDELSECPAPKPKEPSVTPVVGDLPDFEKGSDDMTVKHSVTITPGCDTSPTTTIDWSTSGAGGPNQSAGKYTFANDCGSTYSQELSTAKINASDLNDKSPGYEFSRTTTVSGTKATKTGKVYETPFARIFGHDVRVCGDTNDSRFMWDNRAGQLAQKGSFAGLAAIFAANTPNSPFNGLHTNTVSNQRDTLVSTWASLSSTGCSPAAIEPTNITTDPGIDLTSPGKRYYKVTDKTINGDNLGGQVTVDSSGNVIITGNIESSIPPGGLNIDKAPVLLIKANNIYIYSGVTRIDAVLVANQNIDTCRTAAGEIIDNDKLDTLCRNPLTINGAVNAGGKVSFRRAIGTRFNSNARLSAPPSSPNVPFSAGQANAYTDPAEIINYPPYLNFMPLNIKDDSKSGYDSYIIMPPRL